MHRKMSTSSTWPSYANRVTHRVTSVLHECAHLPCQSLNMYIVTSRFTHLRLLSMPLFIDDRAFTAFSLISSGLRFFRFGTASIAANSCDCSFKASCIMSSFYISWSPTSLSGTVGIGIVSERAHFDATPTGLSNIHCVPTRVLTGDDCA